MRCHIVNKMDRDNTFPRVVHKDGISRGRDVKIIYTSCRFHFCSQISNLKEAFWNLRCVLSSANPIYDTTYSQDDISMHTSLCHT